MKKILALIASLFIAFGYLSAQQIDNVILLDTSESMYYYYPDAVEYLIHDIIEDSLQLGDSFHLLSFNDYPEYEISRIIKGENELQDVLARILLMKPVGKYTDLIAALKFLHEYVETLPLNNIKKIIILTDGIHDPPPGSPYPVAEDNAESITRIAENMRRLGWDVSLIRFPIKPGSVSVNGTGDNQSDDSGKNGNSTENKDNIGASASSDSSTVKDSDDSGITAGGKNGDLYSVLADSLQEEIVEFDENNKSINHEITGAPEIIFPTDLGNLGRKAKVRLEIINHSSEKLLLKLESVLNNGNNLLERETVFKLDPQKSSKEILYLELPENLEKGDVALPVELGFADNSRAYPRKGVLKFNYDPERGLLNGMINGRILLFILAGFILLAAFIFIIIRVIKTLSTSHSYTPGMSSGDSQQAARVMTVYSSENDDESSKRYVLKDSNEDRTQRKKIKVKKMQKIGPGKPGQKAFEMIVSNQNRKIGHRNIHWLDKGVSRSIGGAGHEFYLIFIVPVGRRIAEVVMEENGTLTFIPKMPGCFPELGDNKVSNCVNKPIKMVNDSGLELSLVFREWIPPADKLNRIMHLLEKSGSPEFEY